MTDTIECSACGETVSYDQCEEGAPVKGAHPYSKGQVFCCWECRDNYETAEREELQADAYRDVCEEGCMIDGVGFADPGGRSALRAATEDNPRNLSCPTCGAPNRLTPIDRQRGYQCDRCADIAEGRIME
jgi:hypothetical protein